MTMAKGVFIDPKKDKSGGGKRAAMSRRETVLREEPEGYDIGTKVPTAPILEAQEGDDAVSLERGLSVLRSNLKHMPLDPGVYRMIDARGDPIYVGKARQLKKRVTNYTHIDRLPYRLRRMVAETCSMEIVVTHTEVEALLLESNLIKRFSPRYNVLLRDDKSFPYILLTGDHGFPQIAKHRGAHKRKGYYFGPFASAHLVNRTVTSLEKAFLLRSCSDADFATRQRPCLKYQIKRCSAPCVGKVTEEDYADLVTDAREYLSGASRKVQDQLAKDMEVAAENLQFERAAKLRDRLRAMTAIQTHQDINVAGVLENADVIALHQEGGMSCVQVFFFRAGRNYGNRAYFPSHDKSAEPGTILGAFIGQFYDDKPVPPHLMLSHSVEESELLAQALAEKAGRKVELLVPQRGAKRDVLKSAQRNAEEALKRRQAESSTQLKLLRGVAEQFGLYAPPNRIEVYDNSHIQGAHAIGAMICAGPDGFMKNSYRKYDIKRDGAAGDDFAMMREVFERRFARAIKEDPDREKGQWPDLVLIDGGIGQLNAVVDVMKDLGIDDVPLVSIAKGPDRDAGREWFYLPGQQEFQMEPRDPVLYYLQRLRDEAHRFAIGTHRAKRSAAIKKSPLDDIAGIGPGRKKALLHHFGSARAVSRAGLTDLERVDGISKAVAQKIYDHFHDL